MEESPRPGHGKSDGLLSSLKQAGFRVCEVSKLLQRIKSLEDTIVFRAKFQYFAEKLVFAHNIATIRKFRKLSQGFDLISDFRLRRTFRRWKLRKRWASFAAKTLHTSVLQQISALESDAITHQKRKRQKKWIKLCRGVILESNRNALREVYNEHQMWMTQLYFFNLWNFRLNRKRDIRRARANRWRKLVAKLTERNTRTNIQKEVSLIEKQRKWQKIAFDCLSRATLERIRFVCKRVKQQWLWYEIYDNYTMMNFRKRLEADAHRLRQERNWDALSQQLLHQDTLQKLERARTMCSGCAKVRTAVRLFMHNHVREQLVMERTRRTEKVERRKTLEALAKAMEKWSRKLEIRQVQKHSFSVVRGTFKDATNQYMLSVSNAAALKIQNAFLRMRHKQQAKRRLLERCLLGWRKLPTRVTFNCVEFPEVAVACDLGFNFKVSSFVSLNQFPIDDLAPLAPCYEMRQRQREITIAQVTAEKVSEFVVELLPRPKISAKCLYSCGSRQIALDAMQESKCAIVENESIPVVLDSLRSLSMVTETIVQSSLFLKDQIQSYEPDVDDEFMGALSQRVTRRALNKLFIPPFEEDIQVSLVDGVSEIPELISQYDELVCLDEIVIPDFSLLLNVNKAITPVDVMSPCAAPMNLDVVPNALKRIDTSGVAQAGKEFVKMEPLSEYTAINEPVFEIDDYFLREATSGFGLNETKKPVVDLYLEEFECVRRVEHHKLMIYDRTIHEEAVTNAITFDEVFEVASKHISVTGIPDYRQIESATEKKLEIDEKRVEEPLKEVFGAIHLKIDGLDTYETSGYVEETPEDDLDIDWPLDPMKVLLQTEAIQTCSSSKIVNDDEEFIAREIGTSMRLAVLPEPELEEIGHSQNFQLEEIEELVLQDAECVANDSINGIIPEKEVLLSGNEVENVITKVNVPVKEIPEAEKLDLDSVFDVEIQQIEMPNECLDHLIHSVPIEAPSADEEDYAIDSIENTDEIIESLCVIQHDLLSQYLPLDVPEVDYLSEDYGDGFAFDVSFVPLKSFQVLSQTMACVLPESAQEDSAESQVEEISQRFAESKSKLTIPLDCYKPENVFATWEPSDYCIEEDDGVPKIAIDVSFDGFFISVPTNFMNFCVVEPEGTGSCDVDLEMDLNFVESTLVSVCNLTWDNVECEALQAFLAFRDTIDPEVLVEDVPVVIDCLLNFTNKAPVTIRFVDDEIFSGIIEHMIQGATFGNLESVYTMLTGASEDTGIFEEIAADLMGTLDLNLGNVICDEIANQFMFLQNAIQCEKMDSEVPPVISLMLDEVIDEFVKPETEIEFEPEMFEFIFDVPDSVLAPINAECVHDALFTVPESTKGSDEANAVIGSILDEVLNEFVRPDLEIEFEPELFDKVFDIPAADLAPIHVESVYDSFFVLKSGTSTPTHPIFESMLDAVLDEFVSREIEVEFEPGLFDSIFDIPLPLLTPVHDITKTALFVTPVIDKGLPVYSLNPQIEALIEGSLASSLASVLLGDVASSRTLFVPEKPKIEGDYKLPSLVQTTFTEIIDNVLGGVFRPEACLSLGATVNTSFPQYQIPEQQKELTESLLNQAVTNAAMATISSILDSIPPKSRIKHRKRRHHKHDEPTYELPQFLVEHLGHPVIQIIGESALSTILGTFVGYVPVEEERETQEDEPMLTLTGDDIGLDNALNMCLTSMVSEHCNAIQNIGEHRSVSESNVATKYVTQMLEETLDEMMEPAENDLSFVEDAMRELINGMIPIPHVKNIIVDSLDHAIFQVPVPEGHEEETKEENVYELPEQCLSVFNDILTESIQASFMPFVDLRVTQGSEEEESEEKFPRYNLPESTVKESQESLLMAVIGSAVGAVDAISRLGSYTKVRKHKRKKQKKEQERPERDDLPKYKLPSTVVDYINSDILVLPMFLHRGWDPILMKLEAEEEVHEEEEAVEEEVHEEEEAVQEEKNFPDYQLPKSVVEVIDGCLDATVPSALFVNPNIGIAQAEIEEGEEEEQKQELPKYELPQSVKDSLTGFVDSVSVLVLGAPKMTTEEEEEEVCEESEKEKYQPPQALFDVIQEELTSAMFGAVGLNPDICATKRCGKKHRKHRESKQSKEMREEEEEQKKEASGYDLPEFVVDHIETWYDSHLSKVAIGLFKDVMGLFWTELEREEEENIEEEEVLAEEPVQEIEEEEKQEEPPKVVIPYELPKTFLTSEQETIESLITTTVRSVRGMFDIVPILVNDEVEDIESHEEESKSQSEQKKESEIIEEEEETPDVPKYELPEALVEVFDSELKGALFSSVIVNPNLFVEKKKNKKHRKHKEEKTIEPPIEEEHELYSLPSIVSTELASLELSSLSCVSFHHLKSILIPICPASNEDDLHQEEEVVAEEPVQEIEEEEKKEEPSKVVIPYELPKTFLTSEQETIESLITTTVRSVRGMFDIVPIFINDEVEDNESQSNSEPVKQTEEEQKKESEIIEEEEETPDVPKYELPEALLEVFDSELKGALFNSVIVNPNLFVEKKKNKKHRKHKEEKTIEPPIEEEHELYSLPSIVSTELASLELSSLSSVRLQHLKSISMPICPTSNTEEESTSSEEKPQPKVVIPYELPKTFLKDESTAIDSLISTACFTYRSTFDLIPILTPPEEPNPDPIPVPIEVTPVEPEPEPETNPTYQIPKALESEVIDVINMAIGVGLSLPEPMYVPKKSKRQRHHKRDHTETKPPKQTPKEDPVPKRRETPKNVVPLIAYRLPSTVRNATEDLLTCAIGASATANGVAVLCRFGQVSYPQDDLMRM